MGRQIVFTFDEAAQRPREEVGGKGAGLAEMAALGLPVPPGFTVSTTVARAFAEEDRFPKRFDWQFERGIRYIEEQANKAFGSAGSPLMASVRSGAAVSMPGMMDTVLNVSSKVQVLSALEEVFRSWNTERAQAYRESAQLPDWWGTAVTVQAMVFGDAGEDSATGVAFSHNLATGEEGLVGEFLVNAQGEELVSGSRTPRPISELEAWDPSVYKELAGYVGQLSEHYSDIVDVEFTVERGKLYLLQVRRAKRSAEAAAIFAVRQVWANKWSREQALERVPIQQVERLERPEFEASAFEHAARERLLAEGMAASSGAATGRVVFSSAQAVEMANAGEDVVLVRHDTSPEDLPGMLKAKAIVTAVGGASCHAAMVAHDIGLPAVVGAGDLSHIRERGTISVCGTSGKVVAGAVLFVERALAKEINIFLRWVERSLHSTRELNFSWIKEELNANYALNDFYLADAMAKAAAGSKLEAEARKLRESVHNTIAEQFACYLAIAVAGEIRHAERRDVLTTDAKRAKRHVFSSFGISNSQSRTYAQEAVVRVLEREGRESQTEFFRCAVHIFDDPSWGTPGYAGYGGYRWARIAEAGFNYLSGEWSPSVFVDRVFDLRHNGGQLFNKHLMFNRRTVEDMLHAQLDRKKQAQNIGELHFDLLSPEVKTLWRKGMDAKLWKPQPNRPAEEQILRYLLNPGLYEETL